MRQTLDWISAGGPEVDSWPLADPGHTFFSACAVFPECPLLHNRDNNDKRWCTPVCCLRGSCNGVSQRESLSEFPVASKTSHTSSPALSLITLHHWKVSLRARAKEIPTNCIPHRLLQTPIPLNTDESRLLLHSPRYTWFMARIRAKLNNLAYYF